MDMTGKLPDGFMGQAEAAFPGFQENYANKIRPADAPTNEPFSVLEKVDMVDGVNSAHAAESNRFDAHLIGTYAAQDRTAMEQHMLSTGVDHRDEKDDPDVAEKSDYRILNERIDELMRVQRHQGDGIAQIVNSVNWIVTMLSGVAQMAQSMPGMGGMMARMMGIKGSKGGN